MRARWRQAHRSARAMQADTCGAELRAAVWDAMVTACTGHSMRTAVAHTPRLLGALTSAALGRGAQPPERIPALHALASCLGAEVLGEKGAGCAALLAEEVCRIACFAKIGACAGRLQGFCSTPFA